jgi:S-DNA-T family DNA segregation ATPase FtsK/SpoIIIE
MVDPKMLELSVYEGIPHLLAPVVTDMKQAANAQLVRGRDGTALSPDVQAGRAQSGWLQPEDQGRRKGWRKIPNPFSLTPETPEPLDTLPLIVVVIDELADLMMVAGKN